MSSQSPISMTSPLAGNPSQPLLFSQEANLGSGEKAQFSDPQALRAMVALMDMQAVQGGAASHWGGPSAFSEITSAIYGLAFQQSQKKDQPWHKLFHLINDAGHCENVIYALKANYGFADLNLESLKGFRSMKSPLTGHGESHLFPQGVYLSNGPLGSSLPQAQGLAVADSLSKNDRVTVTTLSDGAAMEGEAKEAFAAIPGLAAKGSLAPFIMVISDNNTKLSGRIDEQCFSMKNTFRSLQALGWEVVELKEGNDLQKCVTTFEQAVDRVTKNPKKPIAIWAHTIKGFGVESTEKSASGGHGFPLKNAEDLNGFLKEIYKGSEVPPVFTDWVQELVESQKAKTTSSGSPVKKEKVQVGVAKALSASKKAGRPVISVTSDLPGSTGVAAFQKEFPDSFVDVGVAESNMVSVAAGLSKSGYIPVVDTFSQFGVTKGALPFLMANLSQAPMIAIFSHAGFQDAADGASHQALNYFSMTCSLPNTEVYALATSEDAEALVSQAITEFYECRKKGQVPKTYIFFLGRETFVPSVSESSPQLGHSQIVKDTSDQFSKSVTLLAGGPLLHQALLAADALEKKSVGAVVVNPLIINEPDLQTLSKALKKTSGYIVTLEDHQLKGGMGAYVSHALNLNGDAFNMKSLGVKGVYGQSAYSAIELYTKHGLDSDSIVKEVEAWL